MTPGGFPQSKKATEQVVREGSFELDISANRALDFFTPEGERAWVKGWDPKPLYPPQVDVPFKANSVFRVDEGEEHSLWTIVEADLQEHIAEYIYVVVAYTDGITEAENPQHELWGQQSLEAVLKSCGHKSPEEILNAILERVSTFTNGQPQHDDETLLVMRVEAGCDD